MQFRANKKLFHRAFVDVVLARTERKSLRQAAKVLGITDNKLHQNISTLGRNRDYSSEFWQHVCKALRWSADQLDAALDAALDEQEIDPVRFIDESIAEILPLSVEDTYRNQVEIVLSHLPKKAEYTFVTHEPPWEFVRDSMAELVARKLKDNISISYIFPSTKDPDFEEAYQAFTGTSDFSWTTLRRGFMNFKADLKGKYGLNKAAQNRLNCWFSSDRFLMNPLTKIAAFTLSTDRGEEDFALLETTVRIAQGAERRHWWPLSTLQCEIVSRAIRNVTQNTNPYEEDT